MFLFLYYDDNIPPSKYIGDPFIYVVFIKDSCNICSAIDLLHGIFIFLDKRDLAISSKGSFCVFLERGVSTNPSITDWAVILNSLYSTATCLANAFNPALAIEYEPRDGHAILDHIEETKKILPELILCIFFNTGLII